METEKQIPENFISVITDFTKDLSITFPEYTSLWSKWVNTILAQNEIAELFNYCLSVYPERFFDILYQNADIFKSDSQTNTMFLPNVEFKMLFNCEGVSENTKKSIWKYLQLMLFTVIGGIKDKATFGDSLNMFDGIDENELQEKLKETMENVTQFFTNMKDTSEDSSSSEKEKPDFEKMFENMPNSEEFKKAFEQMPGMPGMAGMPDIENIQDHLKTLFNGKIGSLAKEMAEEISEEFTDLLGENLNDLSSTEDVVKNLMKNPKKIMDLMKTVSGKLDKKMASGEISKDEIMKEASDLMSKMKDMGGTDQFNELFKNLTKGMGLGKNARVDTNALDRMTKKQTMRERLLKKLEAKKQQDLKNEMKTNNNVPANYSLQSTQDPNSFVFSLPDQSSQEKSLIQRNQLEAELLADEDKEKQQMKPKKNKKKGKK
jgi:hypothetical protein